MKRFVIVILVCIFVLSIIGCSQLVSPYDYDSVVKNNPYFIHALGGDNGFTYLNCLDVMKEKYDAGFRLFEGDATLTSDGRLVMTHRWNKKNIETYLGLTYNEDDPIPTFDEFMSWKIQGSYQATSFQQVLDFMREHPDVVLMLDSGIKKAKQARPFFEAVLQETGEDKTVLDRVMLSVHNEKVLEAGLEIYNFKLRNFYIAPEEARSEKLKTIEQIIAYCKQMRCQSCSISTAVVTEDICKALQDAEIYLYVFTTNDQDEANRLLRYGATSIGTDFLE